MTTQTGTTVTDMAETDFLADFATMSTFGATEGGGVERQAASESDGQTRAWFTDWLSTRGFEVDQDPIGNIVGTYTFTPGAPFVLFGSHLDSQPLAGRFDGAYGVLAAGHAAYRVIQAHQAAGTTPKYNVAVVDWFNEEGSRFKPSMMGSAVYTGLLDLDKALATTDPAGVTVAEALDAISGRGSMGALDVAAYGEIHIEQGKLLEEHDITIGVVESTWCAYKYEIAVHGQQAHTGSTRMVDRKDALLAASMLVVALRELCSSFEVETLHTSVGELYVLPNSPVAIAREVRLLADLRAPESSILTEAFALLETEIAAIEERTGCTIEITGRTIWDSGPFPTESIKLTERSAEEAGHSHMRLLTLAGHDATNMKERVPTVLVFVPSVQGHSHSELEYTSDEDLVAGVDVFTRIVAALAEGELDGAGN